MAIGQAPDEHRQELGAPELLMAAATRPRCWQRRRLARARARVPLLVGAQVSRTGWCLGGRREIQYRPTTMRMHRQQQATGLAVLAVLLGTLWVGGLAARSTDDPTDQLTVSRPALGVEAAVPPQRAPALRPSPERPDPGGRLDPLLLGMLAAVAAGHRPSARRRSARARAASPVWSNQREARAPPSLQPA
jgi:hypothetical protein